MLGMVTQARRPLLRLAGSSPGAWSGRAQARRGEDSVVPHGAPRGKTCRAAPQLHQGHLAGPWRVPWA